MNNFHQRRAGIMPPKRIALALVVGERVWIVNAHRHDLVGIYPWCCDCGRGTRGGGQFAYIEYFTHGVARQLWGQRIFAARAAWQLLHPD